MMTAEQVKFVGQEPVKDGGETLAVTLVTANAGGGGVYSGGGVYTPDETMTCAIAVLLPAAFVAVRV